VPHSPRTLLILRLFGILVVGLTLRPVTVAVAQPLLSADWGATETVGPAGQLGRVIETLAAYFTWGRIADLLKHHGATIAYFAIGLYLTCGGTRLAAPNVQRIWP
jgi:hypothetical protein